MKVLFLGESQIRFLSKLYVESGHEVRVQRGRGKLSKLMTLPDLLWADVVYHVYGTDINRLALLRVAKLLRKKIILQFWIMKYSLVSNHISHYLVCLSSPIRIIHKKQNLLHNLPFFPLFI